MFLKILIVTPDRSFGEQISGALQEANYCPLFTPNTAEAAFIVQYEKCRIAILDCDLPDPGPTYLATQLRAHINGLRIIFIQSSESSIEMIDIDSARDIYLPHPFFLPDLLEVIHLWIAEEKAFRDEAQLVNEPLIIPSELAWLQDANLAAQYLSHLSLEVDAQAALIIRTDQLWVYAGQLSQTAAEELAKRVEHLWANSNGSDLAQFVRLESTNDEYMLYATSLGSGFVLALSYITEFPFSKMRAQTGVLARKLTSPQLKIPMGEVSSSVTEELLQLQEGEHLQKNEWVLAHEDGSVEYNDQDWSSNKALIERQQAMFEDLPATLDIPDPDGSSNNEQIQTNTALSPSTVDQSQELKTLPDSGGEKPLLFEMVPTQIENPLTQLDVQLEPESFALHDLAYSCVLIPRLPNHHLTGVLTGLLNVEMVRLCLTFGWQLEHLGIRPQYLHWVVSVSPDVAASQVIQKIREHSSILIFNEFPRLSKENPSGDFWAPGFMVIHGRRSLAGSLVQNFIQKTRARQGIDNLSI